MSNRHHDAQEWWRWRLSSIVDSIILIIAIVVAILARGTTSPEAISGQFSWSLRTFVVRALRLVAVHWSGVVA